MTTKTKIIIANILIILGMLFIALGFVLIFVARKEALWITLSFAIGVLFIVLGGVFWKKSNHPVAEQITVNKSKKIQQNKHKKDKKQFITKNEWDNQEEEDDEMIFIEEAEDE